MTSRIREIAGLLTGMLLFLAVKPLSVAGAPAQEGNKGGESALSFSNFYQDGIALPLPKVEIPLLTAAQEKITLSEGESREFSFHASEAGLYALEATWRALPGRGSDLRIRVRINGKTPYQEADTISLTRRWKDAEATDAKSHADTREIIPRIPEQEETDEEQTAALRDNIRFYGGALLFPVKEGENVLQIEMLSESMILSKLFLANRELPISYSEMKEDFSASPYEGKNLIFEAENIWRKSDPSLYAVNDNSSAEVSPSDPFQKLLNTVGGTAWQEPGQYIEWKFQAPEKGLYRIAFKYRQDFRTGMSSYRRILLDGEVPYAEMEAMEFPYSSGYRQIFVGGDEVFLFEMDAGEHTLRMEVVLGEMSEILPEAEQSVANLNTAYRKIVMVTGTNPDSLRDYQLETVAADVIALLKNETMRLSEVAKKLKETMGSQSDAVRLTERLVRQLEGFVEDPYTITSSLNAFKSNIASLGTWLVEARAQPLRLDTITLCGADRDLPGAKAGFFDKLRFEVLMFLHTFTDDYRRGTSEEESITVWITSGQTQLSILKQMIESGYEAQSPVKVDLRLVTSPLLMAVVSGKGPDVAMGIDDNSLMNFAFRSAITDLSRFPDLPKVLDNFRRSAIVPIEYQEQVYGLPDTQSFPMLYFRKDVLQELGIEVPRTWDQVVSAMSTLKKKNLEFGIPTELTSYYSLLYQYGGSLYNEYRNATTLTSLEAIQAFSLWCKLYTDYKAPLAYNPQNRFRTGEMPLLIADLSLSTTLNVLAPELQGSWGMTVLPGTAQADGSLNIMTASVVTATAMLKTSKTDACWEFMKWWSSSDVQAKYARNIEQAMGESARVMTANQEAFGRLGWSRNDLDAIKTQSEQVFGIPSVPGSYYTGRYISNALNEVLYKAVIPGEALANFSGIIDEEIQYKREELGLE